MAQALIPSQRTSLPFPYHTEERLILDVDGFYYKCFPLDYCPIAYIVPDGMGSGGSVLSISGIAHGAIHYLVQNMSDSGPLGPPMLLGGSGRVKALHDYFLRKSYIAYQIPFSMAVIQDPSLPLPKTSPVAVDAPTTEPAPPKRAPIHNKGKIYGSWTETMKTYFKDLITSHGRNNLLIHKKMSELYPDAFNKSSRSKTHQIIHAKKSLGLASSMHINYRKLEGKEFRIPRALAHRSRSYVDFINLFDTECPNWLKDHGLDRTKSRARHLWKELRSPLYEITDQAKDYIKHQLSKNNNTFKEILYKAEKLDNRMFNPALSVSEKITIIRKLAKT